MHKPNASAPATLIAARTSPAARHSPLRLTQRSTGRAAIRGQFRWVFALLLALGIGLGIVVAGTTTWMVNATSTTNYCATSCHTMQWAAAGYESGPHFNNTHGVRATCSDCHIPFESEHATPFQYVFCTLCTKAISGTKDVIAEFRGVIDDQAKWEQERPRLSADVRAWLKETGSATCQGCHKLDAFASETTTEVHASLIKAEHVDCVECHTDVGHRFVTAKP